jgi:excisionase family DNA binding protein
MYVPRFSAINIVPTCSMLLYNNRCTYVHLFLGGRMQIERLYSVVEAAKRLGGISKWTIHAWLSQGRLQRTKVGGRTMIRESELAKVIEDGGKSPSPRRLRG